MGKATLVQLKRGAIKEREMLDYKSFVKDGYIYVPVINAETGEILEYHKGKYESRDPKNKLEEYQSLLTGEYDEKRFLIGEWKNIVKLPEELAIKLGERANKIIWRIFPNNNSLKNIEIKIGVSGFMPKGGEIPVNSLERKLLNIKYPRFIKYLGYLVTLLWIDYKSGTYFWLCIKVK